MEGKLITACVLWVESCDTPIRYKVDLPIEFFRLDDGAYRIEYGAFSQEIVRHSLPSAAHISQFLRKVCCLRIASFNDFKLLRECICDIDEYERKEKETTEMIPEKNYFLVAEHRVSCIIRHQKQEEVEICVKIVKHASGRYEVIYKNDVDEPCYSHTKFYTGVPCLVEIREDLEHFYWARHININDIMVLLDEACCVSRRDRIAKQLMNSRYGLASADIRDCFGDSAFDKIYNNLDISREMRFAYTGKWPMIECKTTAKEQYRNRGKLPEISEVIFNKPATIVKWADGTKTVVKTRGKERYNKEKGLAMAIAKKAMGNTSYYYTIMERYLEGKK